jgi:ribA/ribD-fused uncharacterized protein
MWDYNTSKEVMRRAQLAKYRQNSNLSRELLKTKKALLVEANPYDSFWGAGTTEEDARSKGNIFPGHNYMGRLLESVRANLALAM